MLSSCQHHLTDPSLVDQQGPPKPPNPTAEERRHGRLARRPGSASWSSTGKERPNQTGLIAWKWLTFAGTSGATKVGLPSSPGPWRHKDFLGTAQNREYRLIISALSHKEELGDGVPYLHSPPLVPGSCSTGASPPLAQVLRWLHVLQPHQLEEGSSSSPRHAPPHPVRLAWHNRSLAGCLLLGRGKTVAWVWVSV